jgi:nicotinamidase-related amidase
MRIPRTATLLLIDQQEKLMPAVHDAAGIIARCVALMTAARLLGVEVRATEHVPEKIGPLVPALRQGLRPAEVMVKRHFAATSEPGLEFAGGDWLLTGAEAHVCVLQTALGLRERGKTVWLVADAAGSRRIMDRDRAFARLAAEGVRLVTTEMVLFEWLDSADHPEFRSVLSLIKGLAAD